MKKKEVFVPASCSSMTLTSESGKHYWFRTCDIETDLWKDGAHAVQQAAGEEIVYGSGRKEVCAYSFLGMTYNTMDTWLLDGVNEYGLTGGLLMLNEGTSVEKAEEGRLGYIGMELVTKMLSSCRNVSEVTLLAEQVQILNIPYGKEGVPAAMHYFFTDAQGDEVILEAADRSHPGRLRIYPKEESLGVMTNSPPYEKQKENLAWFLSQSPEMQQGLKGKPIKELSLDGRKIQADEKAWHLSQTGTFPASYSSYDRFIRVTVLKALNDSGNHMEDEKMLAFGSQLMNAVNEPPNQGLFHYTRIDENGRILGQKDGKTQYLIVYDIEQKCFYLKVFDMVSWVVYALKTTKTKIKYEICHQPMLGILEGNTI